MVILAILGLVVSVGVGAVGVHFILNNVTIKDGSENDE
jgi:hypothetical protein